MPSRKYSVSGTSTKALPQGPGPLEALTNPFRHVSARALRDPATSAVPVPKLAIRQLRRAELPIDTIALAKFLIGKVIVRELSEGRLIGKIVETEAYPPKDPAAHHFRGETPRNRSMFSRRGLAYVYFTYGNHFMLNVTAEAPGIGGGVLIRALQPLEGIEHMQRRRGTQKLRDLTRGPGRLAEALDIDRSLDGVDLCAPGMLWLGQIKLVAAVPLASAAALGKLLGVSIRIGITHAADRHLRFFERHNPFVSGPNRLNQ